MPRLCITFLLLFLASHSFAFGAKGHRVIAKIADNYLSETARSAINDLLEGESLASVSTWADEMRYSNDKSSFWSYDYSSNWHFINIDAGQSYRQSKKNNRGDAYVALLGFIATLEDTEIQSPIIREGISVALSENTNSDNPKQIALKFLIHLVGDLHQPLHLGYEKDRGGNGIEVKWFNRTTNLHSVWDSRLVESQDLSIRAYEKKLMASLSKMSEVELTELQKTSPMDWINDDLVLRDEIYDIARFDGQFDESYVKEFTPLVEKQMIKAGLRLAALLNAIFEP